MENHSYPPPFNDSVPPIPETNLNETDDNRPTKSLSLKILFIAILTLVLLIPDAIIYSLTSDRQETQQSTTREISQSWSGPQSISGPIISIPYIITGTKSKDTTGVVRLLPATLKVNGDVKSQKLSRSIYESVVYNTDITIDGTFDMRKLRGSGIPTGALQFDKAYVTVGIGDLKGVEQAGLLTLGDKRYELNGTSNNDVYVNLQPKNNSDYTVVTSKYEYEPMIDDDDTLNDGCMQAPITLSAADSTSVPYSITFKLKGSESLGVTPIGGESDITITGECASPSFGGMFIPSTRTVKDGTFTANWLLNSNNRQYPQSFSGNKAYGIARSAVVVNMLVPVDRYQKVERSIKYAVIVILLTFIAVLFAEIMTKHPIHMFQYLLIGLALILFYSLLLSLSEHISFGLSYLIASVMTIGLVGMYMLGVIHSRRIAIMLSALLAVIYLFIYVLLCLETFALLTGSIGLFIALAAIMYVSLKINNGKTFTV